MADYPAEWESDVVLADGSTAHVRPIRPDDTGALLGLWSRLSAESIYLRFFSYMPRPSERQLEALTNVDYTDRMALVAELGSELVAVARYERRANPAEAEVAFVVEDAQQGRGIGTILLEHLAAVARANGVYRFLADTLPENRRMIGVFRDAGWHVDSEFADGLVSFSFPIDETGASSASVEERGRSADVHSIDRLLHPRSIAVIGAGRESGVGHVIFRNLVSAGFVGPVYPVNEAAGAVAGTRAYPSVLDVPDRVDLAVVAVPRRSVREVAEECARKGVAGLVVVTSGFGEASEDGARLERDLVQLARRHGMRLVGPNALGLIDLGPSIRMNATYSATVPLRGRVALMSQSGGLGPAIIERTRAVDLGLSTFVSVGNKADVSGNDLLQFWEQDDATDVILLYLESFGNPRRFVQIARRVARTKPIVAVSPKTITTRGQARPADTGELAVRDVAAEALFQQAGVVRVDSLDQLLDVALVLAHQPLPTGLGLAVVANAGREANVVAHTARSTGFDVAEPVELATDASPGDYATAVREARADPAVGAVLVLFTLLQTDEPDALEEAIVAAASEPGPPVIASFLGRGGRLTARGSETSVPTFAFPEAGVEALARVTAYAAWRARPIGSIPELADVDVDAARDVAVAFVDRNDGGGRLPPEDGVRICRCLGIPTLESRRVWSAGEAAEAATGVGLPVALKAASEMLDHRSDVGGVQLHLHSAEAVRAAWQAIERHLGDDMGGAIVQPMAPQGVQTQVAVVQDRLFGPVVAFSLEDRMAELVEDRALRLVPVTDADAHDLVRSLRRSPILFGYRDAPPVDVEALEEVVLRVGRLADEVPEISRLELDPLVVTESGVTAVDAKVRVTPAPSGPLAEVRHV